MRLQLAIYRHTLPPTHILFSTAPHPSAYTSARDATISDLLHDVNDLVPLESENGAWGLEDYVVEVAATADQDKIYEALHFQTIENLLREDDEVVIRYLKSDELKSRRWGGRWQITGNGSHLVDGVIWGRRWDRAARAGGRPAVGIPPRKKRGGLRVEGQREIAPEDPLLAVMAADDHDDEDYVDEALDEVTISSTFDDIDGDDDDNDSDLDDMDDDEAQLLLEDAERPHNSDPTLPKAPVEGQLRARDTTQWTSLGKRKRSVDDESGEESEFDGFSTPAKFPARRQVPFEDEIDTESASIMVGATVVQATNVDASHVADEDEDESSETGHSSSSGASSSTSSGSDDDSMISDASGSSVSGSGSDDSDSLHSSQESSSESESESESEAESEAESESESETSSLSDSHSDIEQRTPKSNTMRNAFDKHVSPKPKTALIADAEIAETPSVAPGQGKLATRKKNERVKKVKLLKSLKDEGLLAANANFEDLRAYQASLGPSQGLPASTEPELEAARLRALGSIQESTSLQGTQVSAGTQGNEIASLEGLQDRESVKSKVIGQTPNPTKSSGTTESSPRPPPGSSERRSRLDVAASRRLLFGSLGLKNPKSTDEEQQLREKLAKPVQAKQVGKPAERRTSPLTKDVKDLSPDDGWEKKLMISAVECDKEGMKMTPPPFPFQQHWTKKRLSLNSQEQELNYGEAASLKPVQQPDLRFQDVPNTDERLKLKKLSSSLPNFAVRECYEALRLSNWAYDAAVDHLFNAEASRSQEAHAQSQSQDTQRPEDPSDNGSRTVSFAKDDADGMPIPTNFETLTDLEQAHLLPGAVIAYKELCMGEETNFQPGISSYRVGRVSALDTDGYITFTLAFKDRKKPVARDPETGKAIANNFEVRESEDDEKVDEIDDGIREMEFTQMITPKLVEVGVQVPDSSILPNMRGRDAAKASAHERTEIVPDSAPTGHRGIPHAIGDLEVVTIDIDTPRRQEIVTLIKEAGFDSVVGEQLLKPLSSKAIDNADDAQVLEDQAAASFELELVQQPAIPETSQPGTNGWPSSALFTHENPTSPGPHDTDLSLTKNDELESSPPVSPQLTVEYPQISQMELDSPFHAPVDSSKNSSSHQDAQRVPAVPTIDLPLANVEEHEESFPADDDDVQLGDEALDDLRSEVSQSLSQSQEASNLQLLSELHDSDAPTPRTRSFLGRRGADGAGSSPDAHGNDDETGIGEGNKSSDDSLFSDEELDSDDSLPSLAELTSSQRRKIGSKKTTSKNKLSISKRLLSPPKSRASRNPRSHDTNEEGRELRKENIIPSFNFEGPDDLPPSSQPEPESSFEPSQTPVKIAMSQQEQRMSQIPLGTQVVDLTLSSDPVSPSGSDGEYRTRSRQGNSRGRKVNGVNGTRKAKGKGSKLGASVRDLGGAGTEVGIGTRRFLTAKKSRSQI